MTYSRPQPLGDEHDLQGFECGDPALDEWLRKRARSNEKRSASRTYVATKDGRVVGYYCLAAAAIPRSDATGQASRNMPDPIPAVLLGRLAVDRREQGSGLGRHLVRDAIVRTLNASQILGARLLLVHAASESAIAFYSRLGFSTATTDPSHLMITLNDARRALARPRPSGGSP